MSDIFLHGIQNVTVDDGARPITTVRSSTIGIIGTAPDADPLLFPLNRPVLIAGSRTLAAKLGVEGTLPQAIDSIFDQIAPNFDKAHALASQAKKLKKELEETKKTLAEVRKRAKPYLDIIDKYNHPNLENEFNKQVFKLEQNFDRQLEYHQFVKRQEEQERFNQQRELREQLRLEQEQKKQLAEQEKREQESLARLRRQELEKQRKNEPKRHDNGNDNDYSPS